MFRCARASVLQCVYHLENSLARASVLQCVYHLENSDDSQDTQVTEGTLHTSLFGNSINGILDFKLHVIIGLCKTKELFGVYIFKVGIFFFRRIKKKSRARETKISHLNYYLQIAHVIIGFYISVIPKGDLDFHTHHS